MSKVIEITVRLHHETEKAVLVSDTGVGDDAVWLPKSQVEVYETDRAGNRILVLPEWLALEKGLI